MNTRTILVVGATGSIGRYITRGLNLQNHQIRALVRDKEIARSILPSEIELIEGDLRSVSDLERAVMGVDGVYINLSVGRDEMQTDWHPITEGLKNLLIVSRIYGVKHVIMHGMLSRTGTQPGQSDWWVNRLHTKAIDIVKTSGLPTTIFHCSLFFENFRHDFRRGNTVRILDNSLYPIYWLSAVDFGKQVGNAFFHPAALNREFTAQGTDAWNLLDAAKLFVNQHKAYKVRLAQVGGNLLRLLVRIRPRLQEQTRWFEMVNSYPEKFGAEETWRLFGYPFTSLSEFAKEGSQGSLDSPPMPNFYKSSLLV